MQKSIGAIAGAVIGMCLIGVFFSYFESRAESTPTPIESPAPQEQVDSVSIPSLASILISAFQAYQTIDKVFEEMRKVNTVLDQDDITGIADSGHADGSVGTTIFYHDKNGDLKSCHSMKPGVARVAGEIKIFWANGKDPNILLVVNRKTTEINSLGLLVKGPHG